MDTQSEKPTASLAPPNKAKMGGTLSVKKENAPEFSDKENEVLIRVSWMSNRNRIPVIFGTNLHRAMS